MIIADTGFWLAIANRNDDFHAIAKRKLNEIEEPLITTWPVMTETSHLLLHRLGYSAHIKFINSFVENAFQVYPLGRDHGARIRELISKYRDLPMDLADASLIILAEALGDGRILSTDARDFRTYRWKNHKPFRNLLLRE
jgi:hypothetical protein